MPIKEESRPPRIKDLPLDWAAIKQLAHLINQLKTEPVSGSVELSELKPSSGEVPGLVALASIIAHDKDQNIETHYVTAEEVKNIKNWLAKLSQLIKKFSSKASNRLDEYIEAKAHQMVITAAEKVLAFLAVFEEVTYPPQALLKEIALIYEKLVAAEPQYLGENFFSGEPEFAPRTIESKFARWLYAMNELPLENNNSTHWFTRTEFPLLAGLLSIVRFPPEKSVGTTKLAAAEILAGVAAFLESEGLDVADPPAGTAFDLFNPESWGRGLAVFFKGEQLAQVQAALPEILRLVKTIAPQSGPVISQEIRKLTSRIVAYKAAGHSDQELVDQLIYEL